MLKDVEQPEVFLRIRKGARKHFLEIRVRNHVLLFPVGHSILKSFRSRRFLKDFGVRARRRACAFCPFAPDSWK
eukprot:7170561-Pyramimonas_sp.AAC.1